MLVHVRFARVFAALPLSSSPDKTAMLPRLSFSQQGMPVFPIKGITS